MHYRVLGIGCQYWRPPNRAKSGVVGGSDYRTYRLIDHRTSLNDGEVIIAVIGTYGRRNYGSSGNQGRLWTLKVRSPERSPTVESSSMSSRQWIGSDGGLDHTNPPGRAMHEGGAVHLPHHGGLRDTH